MADFGVMEYMAIASILSGAGSMAMASKGSPDITPPEVPKPTVMPTPDDEAMKAEKRKKLSSLSQRRGRQSTILSDNTQSADLLGG